ncbi:hypothetical protein C8A05DRAFT_13692 [Staphylotrichum tortipilum]|uniref:CBM1 domain-containing protein n=1 Tax=Staphylotrichum tortipilum TaxID=2831512 RepID=A0AAN6MR02_9PEZI|nr:hypothetical protein C8A05DRAFT_13692 [Staphylotrichum longicolle]
MGRFLTSSTLALLAAAGVQAADVAVYGQCGGIGYTGSTTCVAGSICMHYNDWYYQCIPGTSSAPVPSSTSTTSTKVSSTTSSSASSTSTAPVDNCSVQYLISFGDSYSQTGFDVTGTKPSSSNPLGNPALPGWTASGGLNWVGYLASVYNQSTMLSYNFAYGGATTNATIVQPYTSTVLSLIDQVTLFSGSIAKKPSYAPWGDNALFAVWIGVNDVGNSWWKSDYDQIVSQIMDTYFGQLKIMYNAGARNFALLTVPPIQRTPAVVAQGTDAVNGEAAAIAKYNAAISTRLAAFTSANSGITAKIIDTTVPFNKALDNPTAYGAPDNTCFNGDGKSCLWFNDYHPGIEINRLVAEAVVAAWKGSYW